MLQAMLQNAGYEINNMAGGTSDTRCLRMSLPSAMKNIVEATLKKKSFIMK